MEKQEKQDETSAVAPSRNWGGRRENQTGRPPGPARMPTIPSKLKETFAAQYKREMRAFAGEFFEIYKRSMRSGDSKVILDAANRLMGRPVTSVELSGPGGQPIRMQAAAAVALALSDPAQLSALAAFTRLVAPDAGEGDDDQDDVAGELGEGEADDPAPDATQDIIVREPVAESPQATEPQAVDPVGTEIADWLNET